MKNKDMKIEGVNEIGPEKEDAPDKPKQLLVAYKPEFLEVLLNYLDTKPHREVRALIDEIQKGQQVEV